MRDDAVQSRQLPLALTQGDPSGIGPEIALKAWLARQPQDRPWFLLADPDHIQRVATELGLHVQVRSVIPGQVPHVFGDELPVVPLSTKVSGAFGKPHEDDASATLEAIERAVSMTHAGEAAGVVTNPIAKDVLYRAGFRHPGHTEWLGELGTKYWNCGPCLPVMLLWSRQLAVVPVTIHVALSRAITDLTTELIVETSRIVARDYREKFGISAPRLAIAGLNPHAGESGSMGREDIDIIAPAVRILQSECIDVRGPLPPDTMFHAAARAKYDVAICMYHDQALIPIKTLAFDEGVNTTLGLPFVRTSPDHGTAFDIAGKGVASETSLLAAIRLADQLASVAVP